MAQSQTWQWAQSAIGKNDDSVNSVTTDASGNVYATGYYYGDTLTVGNYTLVNNGNYDFFVIKFDPNGNVVWAKSGGGIYDEVGLGITADVSGEIYVTGYFYSPGFTIGNFTLTNAGVGDAFIIKYDTNGNPQWAKGIGGSNEDNGNAICVDPSGNVAMTGFFSSPSIPVGTDTLKKSTGEDVFVLKLNALGTPLWARGFEGAGNDRGHSITSDGDGNIVITGESAGPWILFGSDTLSNSGSNDVFVAKLNTNGTGMWARNAGGIYNDAGNSVNTDAWGNIVVTGTYNSPSLTVGTHTLTNKGGFDFFVTKYSPSGIVIWTKTEGGIFDDTGYGITNNSLGDVFVTGHFHSPDIVLGADTLIDEGIGDFYVVGYDNTGTVLWSKHLGGTADDGTGSICTDKDDNLIVGGYFISPTISCPEFSLTNVGNTDLLVAKLKVVYDLTTVENPSAPAYPLMYPNPTDGVVHLKTEGTQEIHMWVKNEWGQTVYDRTFVLSPEKIDLTGNPPGIYFTQIDLGNKRFFGKLILR